MPGGMQTFVCRHCGHTERGRGVLEILHPLPRSPHQDRAATDDRDGAGDQ